MRKNISFSYKFLIFSFVITIVLGIIIYHFFPFYEIKGAKEALEGILLLSSISLGFYGACLSVLASISNTTVVKEIMQEKEDRKEFVVVSSCTLLVGFLTVISTIIYQVMLSNGKVSLDIINSLWFSIVFLFFCMKLLFILIIFMILFNNKENDKKDERNVYTPKLK